MTRKQQFNRMFVQGADGGAIGVVRGSLGTLGLPTLEERVGLFLRAVHGERHFTNEERADTRERILAAMAAGILTKSEAEFPKNARVYRPVIGANPPETEGIPAALTSSSQHRSSDNLDRPSVGIILDRLADLKLEQSAAAHRYNKACSMLPTVDFAFLPAQVRAARERALATSQPSDLRQNRRLVHRGHFIGVAAIAVVIFICGALRGSWLGQNPNSIVASSPPPAEPKGTSLAAVQPRPVEEPVKRGRELVAAGNISAARLVLRQAAEAGNASAALELGATYDPIYLPRPSVSTAVGSDVPRDSEAVGAVSSELSSAYIATARAWYEKAKELGATEAQERLERLGVVEARGWEGSHVSILFQRAGRRWRAQRR